MTTRYVLTTTITNVEERFKPKYVSGFGADVVMERISLGWFLSLLGSYEAIHMGFEKPNFQKDDKVRITIEKV
jgi:hypothetical protein